jgi:uncharacterized protein
LTGLGKIRILSIDGGGIRGILPGVIIADIEAKLQERTGDANARISDFFDLMVGTSTGGILTCIYLLPDENGRPKFSAQQAVDLYLTRGQQIFSRNLGQRIKSVGGIADEKYSANQLETIVKEYIQDAKLSELLKPCLITSYDIENRRAHFFTSHDAKTNRDFLVREVARATSAAPSYFECAQIKSLAGEVFSLVDGGVFANNPALCGYSEARNMTFDSKHMVNPRASDMILVSIGTGSSPNTYEYEKAKKWGKIGWTIPVIDIMMSGSSETVDYHLKMLFDAADSPEQYIRIEPKTYHADNEMDNAKATNLEALQQAGIMSITENKETISRVVNLLIDNA